MRFACFHQLFRFTILLAWVAGMSDCFSAETPRPQFTGGLTWKSLTNSYTAKVGETGVDLVFWFTNRTSSAVTIYRIEPSCGCTVAEKPRDPWIIGPGVADKLEVKVDFKGKYGSLHKGILVDASSGTAMLAVDVEIPENPSDKPQNRANNLIMALSNRQAVFQGDCVRCHVKPGMGKTGKELYVAVCGVCHEGEHRASMVPDMKVLKTPTNPAYWRQWIAQGR
ncbi:MAG TPA: DUF1573 domain-containing protein, partial [Roseimicrobium sp.]|nr:DUF1573 domain-containing protein [Roseimicrobium sp.]